MVDQNAAPASQASGAGIVPMNMIQALNSAIDVKMAEDANVLSFGEDAGYGIVQEYGGHGVGRDMHEPPHVPNFGRPGIGFKLKAGMVLALEPMFALGRPETEEMADHWTVRMRDGSLSAHFEETVAILEEGPEVLTRIREQVGGQR